MKLLLSIALWLTAGSALLAETHTWDGKHPTGTIEVTCAYFVPSDRKPLIDWHDRLSYFCRRIEQFHAREFGEQSTMTARIHKEPVVSQLSTAELRVGDANAIYYRTLREVDERLKFAQGPRNGFPILLVFSEINWRPLDDFYRLQPVDGELKFEGNYRDRQHFPGAASGGARAAYLADRGVGWGLVSADGWRVPYRGSDCVVYHEGCGHTVGLPHPEPGNHSVMSLGQYHGWLSESWLDKDQKLKLGWEPQTVEPDRHPDLYSTFQALPEPLEPQPGQPVRLQLRWPEAADVASLRVRFQTAIDGPWIETPQSWDGAAPALATLTTFDRPTPVSYRVDASLKTGKTAELWGYFQVREAPGILPQPLALSHDLIPHAAPENTATVATVPPANEIDLLAVADPKVCWAHGTWTVDEGKLVSPKAFGARLELPYAPPEEYRLTLIVEPLDAPNGLILGQRLEGRRFVTLYNYTPGDASLSALENIDGRNVGNDTTFSGQVFQPNRLSQVIVEVRKKQVTMSVDGRTIVHWKGSPDRLSLSDYWKTPNDSAMFIGCYDCRYRFHRISLEPLTGTGQKLPAATGSQPE